MIRWQGGTSFRLSIKKIKIELYANLHLLVIVKIKPILSSIIVPLEVEHDENDLINRVKAQFFLLLLKLFNSLLYEFAEVYETPALTFRKTALSRPWHQRAHTNLRAC